MPIIQIHWVKYILSYCVTIRRRTIIKQRMAGHVPKSKWQKNKNKKIKDIYVLLTPRPDNVHFIV